MSGLDVRSMEESITFGAVGLDMNIKFGSLIKEIGVCSITLNWRRTGNELMNQDFELAFWQLTYLVVSPRRVYKQTYHQYVQLYLSTSAYIPPTHLIVWTIELNTREDESGSGFEFVSEADT